LHGTTENGGTARNRDSPKQKEESYCVLRPTFESIVLLFSPLSVYSLSRQLRVTKDDIEQTLKSLYAILVLQFLQEHLLHWLEALGWMQRVSEGIHATASLESILPACYVTSANISTRSLQRPNRQPMQREVKSHYHVYLPVYLPVARCGTRQIEETSQL
jgi:hypothetical protein